MHVIRLFISILSDSVTSHKITFYSKLYDIDLLENCTHDRTYITLYVHEFLLSLHQHCFLDKKAPRTTLKLPVVQDKVHVVLYPLYYSIYLYVICLKQLNAHESGVRVGGKLFNSFAYADGRHISI